MSKILLHKEEARYRQHNELGGIEMLEASYFKQHFSRHSHEGYTFGVIETGAQRFYRTGANNVAPAGSIILINADDIHNGHAATEGGWSYKALYPLPEQFAQISQELGNKNAAPYFPEPVIDDPELARQFQLVYQTLVHSDNQLLRETLIYATLVKLMTRHAKSRPVRAPLTRVNNKLLLVKEFLDEYPETNVSLTELAELSALNPCYLVRAFQQTFGLAPHAYQIQSRLRHAKNRIKQGNRIIDIAQDLGFYDQSHLHRHFKRAMGITPGQYAQQLKK